MVLVVVLDTLVKLVEQEIHPQQVLLKEILEETLVHPVIVVVVVEVLEQ